MERLLTRNFDDPAAAGLAGYERTGGYAAARAALAMAPEEVVRIVRESNLRGRGGAGFPTGLKWTFVPPAAATRYLVVNADEGEPGTFKDRQLLERDPHQLIEGIVIASHAIGAHACWVYVRGELAKAARVLEDAIGEARRAGHLGPRCLGSRHGLDVHVRRGAGAYICGEETSLLESLEGKQGFPRLKPPFPAVRGAFGEPTIVNNVETLSALRHVVTMGASAFAALGVEKEGGTRIFGVSGHVARPGLYELPVGFNLKKLIFEAAGGVRGGRALKAVIPGGCSTPVMLPSEIDCPLSIEGVQRAGSMAGTGGIVVMDETTCMAHVAWRLARFYRHESCGQCTPCREGTWWLEAALARIEAGRGTQEDLATARRACEGIDGNTICPFGDAVTTGVGSYLRKFGEELAAHVRQGACPSGRRIAA